MERRGCQRALASPRFEGLWVGEDLAALVVVVLDYAQLGDDSFLDELGDGVAAACDALDDAHSRAGPVVQLGGDIDLAEVAGFGGAVHGARL